MSGVNIWWVPVSDDGTVHYEDAKHQGDGLYELSEGWTWVGYRLQSGDERLRQQEFTQLAVALIEEVAKVMDNEKILDLLTKIENLAKK